MKDSKSLRTSIIPMLLMLVTAILAAASSGKKATTAELTKKPVGNPCQTSSNSPDPEVASFKVPNGHPPTRGGRVNGRSVLSDNTYELILANPTLEARNLQLSYSPGSGQVEKVSMDLAPGEQRIIPSFVQYLRTQGVAGIGAAGPTYAGPLTVHDANANAQGVFAGARTLTSGKAGRFGVFYTVQPVFRVATDAWLYGLRQDAENRSNLAIVDTSGLGNGFTIDLFNGDTGQTVSTIEALSLAAGEWMQIGSILASYAPAVHNGYAHVKRTIDSGSFLAYAVINDGAAPSQRTGDGAVIASSP